MLVHQRVHQMKFKTSNNGIPDHDRKNTDLQLGGTCRTSAADCKPKKGHNWLRLRSLGNYKLHLKVGHHFNTSTDVLPLGVSNWLDTNLCNEPRFGDFGRNGAQDHRSIWVNSNLQRPLGTAGPVLVHQNFLGEAAGQGSVDSEDVIITFSPQSSLSSSLSSPTATQSAARVSSSSMVHVVRLASVGTRTHPVPLPMSWSFVVFTSWKSKHQSDSNTFSMREKLASNCLKMGSAALGTCVFHKNNDVKSP